MGHMCLMLDLLWFAILGGVLIGAVALALAGLPLWISTVRSLRAVSDRVDGLEESLYREVKRRASQKGVEARQDASAVTDEVIAAWAAERAGGRAGLAGIPKPGLLRGGNRGPAA